MNFVRKMRYKDLDAIIFELEIPDEIIEACSKICITRFYKCNPTLLSIYCFNAAFVKMYSGISWLNFILVMCISVPSSVLSMSLYFILSHTICPSFAHHPKLFQYGEGETAGDLQQDIIVMGAVPRLNLEHI